MSKIDDLIAELCPDGVRWSTLAETAVVTIGEFVHRNKQTPSAKYPVYNGGTSPTGYYEQYNNTGDKIIVSARGANAGFVNKTSEPYWAGNSCYSVSIKETSILSWMFVFYFLKCNEHKLIGEQQKGGIPAVSKRQIEAFRIPVPPPEVQREIVKVLDTFTKLEAELEAELEARRRQYKYYRDTLLGFEGRDDVRWATLGEVAIYSTNRVKSAELNQDSYIGVDNLLPDMRGRTRSNYVPTTGTSIGYETGDILIGNIRPYLKKIWLADSMGGTNQDVLVVHLKNELRDDITPRFLYHILASEQFFAFNMQFAKGAKMPRGDKAAIMRYEIPIPPPEEQERIVGILDKFDALVNDLSSGLPAEIRARRQQYEYYRDLLLTFREAA